MIKPSFFALFFGGILNLYALFFLISNFKNLNAQSRLIVILLFSIAISSHGLLHGHLEVHSHWNPLAGI
jgi:hypothetical protein